MLVYGHEIGEDDCILNVTSETKNVLVGFFGFFKHNIEDRFIDFLEKELEIQELIEDVEKGKTHFSLNGKNAIEDYKTCDRRTFDLTVILPKTFKDKESALSWFYDKVKNSEYMLKSEFSYIDVLDGDKFIDELNMINERITKRNNLKKEIREKKEQARQELLNKYANDPESLSMIDSLFSNIG